VSLRRVQFPVVLALAVAASAAAPSTSPTPEPGASAFEIPPERFEALDAAGLGWMFDGAGYPAQPDGVAWPTDEWSVADLPETVDAVALDEYLSAELTPREGERCCIDAVLAVQGGELVLERYRDGWNPDDVHLSWSMAKSITQAMLGILVAEGRLDVFAPASVPEWYEPADPRHDITVDELLRMRSGLEWVEEYAGRSDVIELLFAEGATNRAHFAADRPLAAEPDAVWNYSSGSAMILARIIADEVGYFEQGTHWAQEVLFDPLGITSVEHDLDDSGVISGGSAINMTARDFARFGLLYLRGGEWDGTQIIPREWVDYARMPVPDAPAYGALWWVVGMEDRYPQAFQANGFNGQTITIVPELDLVVVMLADESDPAPDLVAARVIEAFGAGSA
jgi:CubicO group peptidase (beta-lactamase class C family)